MFVESVNKSEPKISHADREYLIRGGELKGTNFEKYLSPEAIEIWEGIRIVYEEGGE